MSIDLKNSSSGKAENGDASLTKRSAESLSILCFDRLLILIALIVPLLFISTVSISVPVKPLAFA